MLSLRVSGDDSTPIAVLPYNQQLPQSALGSKTPLQAIKDLHKSKLELFKKQPYYLSSCGI
jgi:hypothetical protein